MTAENPSSYDKVRCKISAEHKAIAIQAARDGLSFTGIAHKCGGKSREWLKIVRYNDPSFNEQLLLELALYEEKLTLALNKALDEDNPALVNAIIKARSNRFPQRHGDDPRLRYSIDTAAEEHQDDMATARAADAMSDEDRDMLRAFLKAQLAKEDAR